MKPAALFFSRRCRRDREHVREGAVHPQNPAGRPQGNAGGDALPVCLPQPVSERQRNPPPRRPLTLRSCYSRSRSEVST